jgi:hypothetical protein
MSEVRRGKCESFKSFTLARSLQETEIGFRARLNVMAERKYVLAGNRTQVIQPLATYVAV